MSNPDNVLPVVYQATEDAETEAVQEAEIQANFAAIDDFFEDLEEEDD